MFVYVSFFLYPRLYFCSQDVMFELNLMIMMMMTTMTVILPRFLYFSLVSLSGYLLSSFSFYVSCL